MRFFTFLCLLWATAAQAASKWPDHEWLLGSTGVAWSNPEMAGRYPRMEIWLVFFGSQFYLPLPLMPFVALSLALSGFFLWCIVIHFRGKGANTHVQFRPHAP